ncbi:MAG: DUF2029 domain-containing protein [Xanthomonadaceae bacterium]|nr:DUF2029 domain-containing protein [Xanthomonadaceae bacterium]
MTQLASQKKPWENPTVVFIFLFILGIWISFFTPFAPAVDLEAYWMTGYNLAHGNPLYAVGDRPGISIQKYSPWMSILFLPIGFFKFETSKWIWTFVQIASYAVIFKWCFTQKYKPWVIALTFICFWGNFAIASVDGYVSPLFLALLLLCVERLKTKKDTIATVLITFLYSARIFQVISLIGLPKKSINKKNILVTAGVFIALTLALTGYSKSGIPFMIIKEWIDNANTTPFFATEFRNYGFPAAELRILGITPNDFKLSLILSAVMTLPALALYPLYTKRFSDLERFMTALGLSLMVSPMTWKSTYVLSFPLALMAFDSAVRSKNRRIIILALASIVLTGFMTSTVFGSFGAFFEKISGKSIGVLGSIIAIYQLRKRTTA